MVAGTWPPAVRFATRVIPVSVALSLRALLPIPVFTAGNIKGFHNVYGNPTTQAAFAEATKQNAYMVCVGPVLTGSAAARFIPACCRTCWLLSAAMHAAKHSVIHKLVFPFAPLLQVASFCDGSKVSFEQVVVAK